MAFVTSRVAIHVIDDDHKRRAQIARFAYALGHHAEVYSSTAELAAHAPHEGVVVALEDAVQGGFSQLVGLLNRDGRWLAVIATSADPSIDKAVRAIKGGAHDYLPFPLDETHLARAIDAAVAEGEMLRHAGVQRQTARSALDRLSPRELDVLGLMAKGMTNKEAGRSLAISPRTVEIHRTNAITKLGAGTSAGAIRMFYEGGGRPDATRAAVPAPQ